MRKIISGQKWLHFKGGLYETLCVSKHTETNEKLVTYFKVNKPSDIYTRPLGMFLDNVIRPDYGGPRFTLVSEV